jgi:hypothetical protein
LLLPAPDDKLIGLTLNEYDIPVGTTPPTNSVALGVAPQDPEYVTLMFVDVVNVLPGNPISFTTPVSWLNVMVEPITVSVYGTDCVADP